ncbi:MAG: hypothetical protein M3155_04400 [Actinomycetota bacterium]|nr:hypothetical protein [Actinomycetota bacterium]
MRAPAAIAVAATTLVLALSAGGCTKLSHRTETSSLNKAFSKAFKLSYAAAYRMTTGRSRRGIIGSAKADCHPRGAEPKGDRGWRWACQIEWKRRDRTDRHASSYTVTVDPRGCFQATSANFPVRLYERALHRPARNPLVYIRSCP